MSLPEILNQKGIDELLAGQRGGGQASAASAEILAYDFQRPSRMARKARKLVEEAQEAFALGLGKTLSAQFRTPVEVTVLAIEDVTFADLTQSLGSPGAASLFPVGPGRNVLGILDWGIETATSFVDRLLGGNGKLDAAPRALTPIEQGVLRRVTDRTLPVLVEAWKEIAPMTPEVVRFEEHPPQLEIAAAGDRYLNTLFQVRSEAHEGVITLGLPYGPLTPRLEPQGVSRPAASTGESARDPKLLGSDLRHSHLEVAVRLPVTTLTMRAVCALQPGQVIDTATPVEAPVQIHVNGRVLFEGPLGQYQGHVGVRITRRASTPEPQRLGHAKQGRVL